MSSSPMERNRQGLSKGGLIEISGPDGTTYVKTFTCCHCSQIVTIDDKAQEMGFCAKCHARECLPCARKLQGVCAPFMRKIEAMEKRAKLLGEIE